MGKIDLHLHLTPFQIPKLGKLNLTSGQNMLPHLAQLGIDKGVLMSGSEKGLPFGTNKANKAICEALPEHYAWMCNLDPKSKEPVFERLARFKAEGAIGIGLIFNLDKKKTDQMYAEMAERRAAAEK